MCSLTCEKRQHPGQAGRGLAATSAGRAPLGDPASPGPPVALPRPTSDVTHGASPFPMAPPPSPCTGRGAGSSRGTNPATADTGGCRGAGSREGWRAVMAVATWKPGRQCPSPRRGQVCVCVCAGESSTPGTLPSGGGGGDVRLGCGPPSCVWREESEGTSPRLHPRTDDAPGTLE